MIDFGTVFEGIKLSFLSVFHWLLGEIVFSAENLMRDMNGR